MIEGVFYAHELQVVKPSEWFPVEKVIQRRGSRSLVKFLGYPGEHWVEHVKDSAPPPKKSLLKKPPLQNSSTMQPTATRHRTILPPLRYGFDKRDQSLVKFLGYPGEHWVEHIKDNAPPPKKPPLKNSSTVTRHRTILPPTRYGFDKTDK